MALRQQLLTMAQYNLWATRELFAVVDTLSDEEYRRDVGLFFKSVHGTLNHIYVAEHDVWYARIHDGVFPKDVALDGEVENDREKIKQMLLTKAERWVPLLESCSDERLEGVFEYHNLTGVAITKSFSLIMAHVFNHGTHHRGQISAGVTMLGHPAPVLDLDYMPDDLYNVAPFQLGDGQTSPPENTRHTFAQTTNIPHCVGPCAPAWIHHDYCPVRSAVVTSLFLDRRNTMALRRQLLTMAQYNVWATRRLFIAVDALSDEEYRRDVGLFFKSVHGTLNHIYVAEHDVWYPRIHDGVFPQGIALDGEVENDREKIKQMLLTKAERWLPLLESCSDGRLEGVFEYQGLSGVPNAKPFSLTMVHVFNHGTHHRGQVSAGVTMLGHPVPVLDLVYMLDGVGK